MVDQTVANLKITVDSTDLTKVNDQLAATGAATDAFNSKLGNTANAAQPARTATQGLANDLNAMAGQTTAASGSFGTLLASIQGFGSGLKGSLLSLQTWKDTWAQMTPAAANLASGTKAATAAVAAHAVETRAAGEATHVMVEALHGARPALEELGIPMGSTREMTMLLHGGFLLLAAALGGGIIASMVKLNDELDESSKKIQAFTGNAHDTKEAMETFGQLAKESGVGVTDFADALAKLMQNGPQVATVVNGLGYSMGRTASASDAYIATLKGITDAMTKMGASTDMTSKVLSDFASSVDKDGTVAKGFWTKLASDAPVVAQNLAAALGFTKNSMQSATQVMTQFGEQGLISFTQLTAGMQKLSSFTQEGEQSISMAWGRIKQAWDEFVLALGKNDFVKEAMKGIADAINEATEKMKGGMSAIDALLEAFKDKLEPLFDEAWHKIEDGFQAMLDALSGKISAWFNSTTVGQFVNLISKAGGMLNTGIDIATQAVGANLGGTNLNNALGQNDIAQFADSLKTANTDALAASKADDQLSTSLNTQKTATDDLAKSAQSVGGAMDPLKTGLDGTTTSAQAAAPAVTSLSGALSGLVTAIQNAVSAMGRAESSASAGAVGEDVVQLPPSAEGNMFQISAGGGKDSIRMTGMVSPDEIVAIIPKENASAGLLTDIQAAIGNSPISISTDGQSGTSVSAIAAPSSYHAYEAMSRYGSPALAPGGHIATASSSGYSYGSAGAVAGATAAASAQRSTSSATALVPVTGADGQTHYLTPDEASVYQAQQSQQTVTINGIQYVRTKWGGYLPLATVNISGTANFANSETAFNARFASQAAAFNAGGASASSTSSTSAAPPVSRTASAAQAEKSLMDESGFTRTADGGYKDRYGTTYDANGTPIGGASLPAAPMPSQFYGPNLPTTVTAPEGQTINNPYYGGGAGGVPLPPEAPGYTQSVSTDAAGNETISYTETGYSSDTGLDFGDTVASSNVYYSDQGYTGVPEGYTGQMGADNMGDFGASLGDPGTADLSYDYGSDYTAGDFATGGGFTVPFGGNGADSVRVRLNASGGERIRVDRPGEPEDDRIGGSSRGTRDNVGDNHFHFYGVQDMDSFRSSRTALRRFVQQAYNS